ncbi:oxidoreductase [Candidatus Magnetomorum sp. HK-1]|nr:oxidoreductase [Candidatus Magnetomorum sp. HK-1]
MNNNCQSIIVVGSGKAALLHLNAYIKLWKGKNFPIIYVIAGDVVDYNVKNIVKSYSPFIQFITFRQAAKLNLPSTLIDVCSPSQTHKAVIERMFDIGFTRFLVEKPLVTTIRDLESIKDLSISLMVMQNYMYSKATKKALELIRGGEIIPESMLSLFCKNRIQDTIQMRGFSGCNPPHTFTIELPHQLYLAAAFLGSASVCSVRAQSMRVGNALFSGHGAGHITLEHKKSAANGSINFNSFHFSCLFSNVCVRRVLIAGQDRKTLIIEYPVIKDALVSKIVLKKDGTTIYQEIFKNDDMMARALEYYYTCMKMKQSKYAGGHDYNSLENELMITEALSKNITGSLDSYREENICQECTKVHGQMSAPQPCISR